MFGVDEGEPTKDCVEVLVVVLWMYFMLYLWLYIVLVYFYVCISRLIINIIWWTHTVCLLCSLLLWVNKNEKKVILKEEKLLMRMYFFLFCVATCSQVLLSLLILFFNFRIKYQVQLLPLLHSSLQLPRWLHFSKYNTTLLTTVTTPHQSAKILNPFSLLQCLLFQIYTQHNNT